MKDIVSCKRIESFLYNSSYYYFELFYQQKQVYRLEKESSCLKWIENINAAINYSKSFNKLMIENPDLVQQFSKVKDDTICIEFNEQIDETLNTLKAKGIIKSTSNKGLPKVNNENKAIKSSKIEKDYPNSHSSNSTNHNTPESKPRSRRKNPYTNQGKLIIKF